MIDVKLDVQSTASSFHLPLDECPKTAEEREYMSNGPYDSVVGSLMYVIFYTCLDICFAVEMITRYQVNLGLKHWQAVKHILRYLKRTRDYMLIYSDENLTPVRYTDSDFQTYKDLRKSMSGNVFVLGRGAIIWRSVKITCTANSTMEVEYVVASEATKEAISLQKFLTDLIVIPGMKKAITLYCDNSVAIANTKETRSHRGTKHIDRKYHLIREAVVEGIVNVLKVASEDNNLADLFTKTLVTRSFNKDIEDM
ncbi:secreted RxLR effector protein 161-like [Gossypium raimondii]|uniref:secreted RxLR effector protein 161-like n=1 Tax=Gossypium raimondii TaxID=29730 RepID=UPI00227CB9FA|nr:secreted RxLR effector protein 161-like [Gossypium raimondii]